MNQSFPFHPHLFKATFLLVAIIAGGCLTAQALHIHYDIETGVPTYLLGKDTIDRPLARYRGEVFFHLENLNTYRFTADVEKTEELEGTGGQNALALFSGLLPGGGLPGLDMLGGGTSAFFSGAGDAHDEMMDFTTEAGLASSNAMAAMEALKADYEAVLLKMNDKEKKIKQYNLEIERVLDQRANVELARREVKRIKAHPGLRTSQIIALSDEFITKALGEGPKEDLDVLTIAENRTGKVKKNMALLQQEQAGFHSYVIELENIQGKLAALNIPPADPTFARLAQSLNTVHDQSEKMDGQLGKRQQKIQAIAQEDQAAFTRDLIELRYEMEMLNPQNFSYTERFEVDGGAFYLQPSIFPIDTFGNRTGGKATTLAPVKVRVRGGLRISTSVGIGLGQYFEAPREYFVRDGFIVGVDMDRFLPIANTMLHFHPYGDGRVVVGGALGVGLPLSGGDSGQSTTFMLGPSLILGERDKVFISAGLIGGQVTRLGGGFKEGDVFSTLDGALLTNRRYELGYYFSLSFKLFGK